MSRAARRIAPRSVSKADAVAPADDSGARGFATAVADGLVLAIRLTPRGGRDAIEGVGHDDAGRSFLRVRVSAAPTEGDANDALLRLLARALDAPRRSLTLAAGAAARLKRVHVAGDAATLRRHLEATLEKLR